MTIIGIKIKGLYLSYLLFWIVFFVPAVLHYELPKKLLRKALPLLEQLDQSMKYERRSVLDKSELLVDVKVPTNDDDDQEEEEYLKSFKFDETQTNLMENLDDGEEDEADEYVDNQEIEYEDEDMDEQAKRHESNQQQRRRRSRTVDVDDDNSSNEDHEGEIYDDDDDDQVGQADDDDEVGSFLPDNSLPSMSDVLDSSNNLSRLNERNLHMEHGDRVTKVRNKMRPSLFEYYGESITKSGVGGSSTTSTNSDDSNLLFSYPSSTTTTTSAGAASSSQYSFNKNNYLPPSNNKARSNSAKRLQQNEHDIDETFDFLDEELNKY